ncbi:MAG TPA: oxygenase MpaB family protein, partial [Trebonia sp.]|nr:oxygenase MpaB family protein [Trebonia sp.]
IGMPDGLAPASTADLDAYLAAVQPALRLTTAAADTAAFLLDPPGLDEDLAGLWSEIRDGVLTVLPDWAADRYGFARPATDPRALAGRRGEIRQALGVLDAVTLGEPGVLEARQRIELRIRHARAGQANAGHANAGHEQAPRQ